MKQKIIQVGNKKLLALDMPEEITKNDIERILAELYHCGEEIPLTQILEIGYDCKIVGFKNNVTEEQWAEIVEVSDGHFKMFPNFNNPFDKGSSTRFNTATESGLSLLQANGIYFKNCLLIQVI